jgi:predicted nuclease of predicted toxin-antitoxin system
MRLLFDECVSRKLKSLFVAAGHDCETVGEAGWEGVTNGELLAKAEFLFDVLVTVDQNLRYQQSFKDRDISLLVLRAQSNDMKDLEPLVPSALAALRSIKPGQVLEISESS